MKSAEKQKLILGFNLNKTSLENSNSLLDGKFFFVLIIICTSICVFVYYSKENEITKLNEENQTHQRAERAAVQKFNEVDTFLKLFPNATYSDGTYIENIESASNLKFNIYFCKLPPFSNIKNNITFAGMPTFEGASLLLQGHSMSVGNKASLTIDEIEKEILKKQNGK